MDIEDQGLNKIISSVEENARKLGVWLLDITSSVKENCGHIRVYSELGVLPINYFKREGEVIFLVKQGKDALADKTFRNLSVNYPALSLGYAH